MDVFGRGFLYLKEKFGKTLSDAKIQAGAFVGPQIRQIIKDETFQKTSSPNQLAAWKSFKDVVENF